MFALAAVIGFGIAGLIVVATLSRVPRGAAPITRTKPALGARFFWETGGTPRSLVPLEEIRSAGPPPDGIPPIDHPKFIAAGDATWLTPEEPVIAFERNGDVRAYPLQILTWHEIVNDDVGGEPVAVTFCPLCNSAIAFSRRVKATSEARDLLRGEPSPVLDFGTSGRLYRSNLVMYDRQTRSLWIQFTGQSVVGPFIGMQLDVLPAQIVSWDEVRRAHPDVKVLSRDTGHSRDYGTNPYAGYDDVESSPFLYAGPQDKRLRPMERVVTVRRGQEAVAYRYADLERLATDGATAVVRDRDLVVLYRRGTHSALDRSAIADSRDVGATGVFVPRAAGHPLTLLARGDRFVDDETGTTWDVLGRATAGDLKGQRLEPVVHDDTFWFVWAAFEPKTTIWAPS